MKTTFTITQFLIILAVNLVFLMLVGAHYFNEEVRTVHDQVTVCKIPPPVQVENCSKDFVYKDMLLKATNICNWNQNENHLVSFNVDDNGKPVFNCSIHNTQ